MHGSLALCACTWQVIVHDTNHAYSTAPITAAQISTEEAEERATRKGRTSDLRKSVSFTPDTKQKDGETGQNYFKAWASGQDPTAINPSAEEADSPSKSPIEQTEKPVEQPRPKKAKKPKKSKSTSVDSKASTVATTTPGNVAGTETTGEIPAYVGYLRQYHHDKDNWKFNKKKQNDLLKNLFNVKSLSIKHEPAIIAYVQGLQGAARDRLAAQAEEVLKSIYEKESDGEIEDMSLSSPQSRKVAYLAALTHYIERSEARGAGRDEYSDEQLNAIREEVEAGRRAQAVLENGLMMELHPEQVALTPATSTATPTPERSNRVDKSKRRKRKTRTTGSASTSDSDSSSSDDSSSDSDDEPAKKTPAKRIFDKELLDQAFPKSRKQQDPKPSSQQRDSDSSRDSSSDESSESEA